MGEDQACSLRIIRLLKTVKRCLVKEGYLRNQSDLKLVDVASHEIPMLAGQLSSL